jgi:hypothetical protein
MFVFTEKDHTITKMSDVMNMDSTIAGSVNSDITVISYNLLVSKDHYY